jgi:hypothetical protein
MKKFTLRVSGSRVGDSTRPTESVEPIALIKAPRFGLKVHRSPLAQKSVPAAPLTPSDYATAEDYD